jgi:hypothetical protein
MESERFGTRPFLKAGSRDTMVMISITQADRRLPHGTRLFQGILHLEEGFKIKTGSAKCPHCRRGIELRLIMERVD